MSSVDIGRYLGFQERVIHRVKSLEKEELQCLSLGVGVPYYPHFATPGS
jgi:hypothetical protein